MSIHPPVRPSPFVDSVDDRTEAEKLTEQQWVDAMAALRAEQDEAYATYLCSGVATYDVRNSAAAVEVAVAELLWAEAVADGREYRENRPKEWEPFATFVGRKRIGDAAPPYYGPMRGGVADRAMRVHGGVGPGGFKQRANDWALADRPAVLIARCEADLARAGQKLLDAEADGDLLEIDRWTVLIASLWQKHDVLVRRAKA